MSSIWLSSETTSLIVSSLRSKSVGSAPTPVSVLLGGRCGGSRRLGSGFEVAQGRELRIVDGRAAAGRLPGSGCGGHGVAELGDCIGGGEQGTILDVR